MRFLFRCSFALRNFVPRYQHAHSHRTERRNACWLIEVSPVLIYLTTPGSAVFHGLLNFTPSLFFFLPLQKASLLLVPHSKKTKKSLFRKL